MIEILMSHGPGRSFQRPSSLSRVGREVNSIGRPDGELLVPRRSPLRSLFETWRQIWWCQLPD